MSNYRLIDSYHLLPSPAGAFYAVTEAENTPLKKLLLGLLQATTSQRVDLPTLMRLLETEDEQQALAWLYQAQTLQWLQGFEAPQQLAERGLGGQLQDLLGTLSSLHKALLVDWNGFPMVRSGLDDVSTESLAALAADLANVQKRHRRRLQKQLGLAGQGWAAVDAYGSSRVGVWPLRFGNREFLLAIVGEPRLNQQDFTTLVWTLAHRYGTDEST